MSDNMKPTQLKSLVNAIKDIHIKLSEQAAKAVNVSLTMRNWLIGYYIHKHELQGEGRGEYGGELFNLLAQRLTDLSNCKKRQLYEYVKFYETYPQLSSSIQNKITEDIDVKELTIVPTLSALSENQAKAIVPTLSALSQKDSKELLFQLSYSAFKLLMTLDTEVQRRFYEKGYIQGTWSVRELKRQITSLLYERSLLSKDQQALKEHSSAELAKPGFNIRDPYIFEFLGLKSSEVMTESDLEEQLLRKLQNFLLELGHGFCFEAAQKRILIGGEHYFIDLVFYHRILKCHVLIELKNEAFSHQNIGQLNTYVSYYRKNEMSTGDNPPIGLLLCTHQNEALAEYALAGMDNQLFISKYQLALPEKERIEAFLRKEFHP